MKELLKGVSASSGRVTGKVKLVKDVGKLPKIEEENFILVIPFTTPLLVPIIMRCSAIITNFGGLTCHASIVAREFNIPCVVGTEKATEILKEGMEVVVDATNGIIYAKN
jgi:pyruvate,water dikinase